MTSLKGLLPRVRDIQRAAAAAPKSDADVEGWRELLSDATSERTFLECFKIQTDLPEDAPEDADPWVPFRLRAWQIAEDDAIERIRKTGRPAKLRMPKARGTGASSYNIAKFGFCRPLRRPGYRTLIIAQDQEESEEHLSRLDDFYQQCDWSALAALGITLERSNRRSITIKFVDPKTGRFLGRSRVRVKTARAKGLGRGGGYDAIVTTERPHWFEKCKRDLKSFLARLSRTRWSAHIDESSPNGLDEFYEDCIAAEKRKGGYELFFIPAFSRPENYIRVRTEPEREALLATLGKSPEHGGEDERESFDRCVTYWMGGDPYVQIKEPLDLAAAKEKALEWVKFRREAIEGECRGSVEHFHQEHGTTLEEAFQGSGRPVLDIATIRSWSDLAAMERGTWRRYSLEIKSGGNVVATENRSGLWEVRELPKKDGTYCFGSDCAGGEEKHADGKTEADFSYTSIGDVYTGESVAELEAHIEPHLYALEIAKASRFWRCAVRDEIALGLVEANNDMGGATINTLMLTDFDWGNGAECVLETTKSVKTDTGTETRTQIGWRTGPKSKEMLVTALRRFISEWGKRKPDDTRRSPWSLRVIQQMTRYVYKGRKMEAESGFDDGVVSEALKQMARRMLIDEGRVPIRSSVAPRPPDPQRDLFEILLRQKQQQEAKARKLRGLAALPGF